jgi:agmatine/peptidylarginine deiminase
MYKLATEIRESDSLAASYVNYYLFNNAVILPQFGDKAFGWPSETRNQ